MENDQSDKDKKAHIDLVLGIIRKVRSGLEPENKPPREPSIIDPHLLALYEHVKSTIAKNSYEQNVTARSLVQQFDSFKDLLYAGRLQDKKVAEAALIQAMKQFLNDRQT